MLQDRTSKFQFFSLGIVLKDKERESDIIEVTPIEEFPLLEGKIKDIEIKYETAYKDHMEIEHPSELKGDYKIIATWRPLCQSNRMTAPDVIENETVIIFRYADDDSYYWSTLLKEPMVRRLETVRYMFGNLKERLVEWDKSSAYWFEVSTHDKHVWLKTVKSDGEPYEYDVKINTAAGTIDVHDDIGNHIHFNSGRGALICTFNELIELNAPRIVMNAKTIVSNASTSITDNTPIYTRNVSNKITENSPLVHNTGNELTNGVSRASPHRCCVLRC